MAYFVQRLQTQTSPRSLAPLSSALVVFVAAENSSCHHCCFKHVPLTPLRQQHETRLMSRYVISENIQVRVYDMRKGRELRDCAT